LCEYFHEKIQDISVWFVSHSNAAFCENSTKKFTIISTLYHFYSWKTQTLSCSFYTNRVTELFLINLISCEILHQESCCSSSSLYSKTLSVLSWSTKHLSLLCSLTLHVCVIFVINLHFSFSAVFLSAQPPTSQGR